MTNVIKIIKREQRKRYMTNTDLARKLNLHQTTVQGMFKSKSLKIQKLFDLCHVFEYNFFREIAEQIPFKNPTFDDEQKVIEQELREEIKSLKLKTEVMEGVIDKLGGSQNRN